MCGRVKIFGQRLYQPRLHRIVMDIIAMPLIVFCIANAMVGKALLPN
jgi:hypothetical protein